MSIFPLGERLLVLHRMLGRSWRRVWTPGYFELRSFPSDSVCKNLWESTSSSYVFSSPPLKSTRVSRLLQLSLLPLMMQNVSHGFDMQLKYLSIKYASSDKDESFAPDRMCQKRAKEFGLCYIKLVYWTVSINSCSLSTISEALTRCREFYGIYEEIYHTGYVLATTSDLASFTENLGGSHDYHQCHFINEKQKSLTQVCAMPKVAQWMTGIRDSTFLEKPGPISVISLTLQTAEEMKIQEKELERLMREECHWRRRRGVLSLILRGGNTGNRNEWGGQSLEG